MSHTCIDMMACKSDKEDIMGLRYTFRKSWYVPTVSSVCVEPALARNMAILKLTCQILAVAVLSTR